MFTYHPPEVLFTLVGLEIRFYGVALGLAVLIGLVWANQRARLAGVERRLADDALFWAVLGGLIGARLGFIVQDLGYYVTHWAEIIKVWEGGLSFHGGLVGGLVGGVLFLRIRKQLGQFWLLADAAAAPLLLGAAIGRLGNWANQELYGYPTDVPWAIAIDAAHRLPGFEGFASFHPTFAYEALLNLIGLSLLLVLIERTKERKNVRTKGQRHTGSSVLQFFSSSVTQRIGASALFAVAWYALARGITEIWRISDRVLGPLSLAQLISIATIVGVIIAAALVRRSAIRLDRASHNP